MGTTSKLAETPANPPSSSTENDTTNHDLLHHKPHVSLREATHYLEEKLEHSVSSFTIAQKTAIAGALAGMFTNIWLHPLDTIKTVRQSNPQEYRGILITGQKIVSSRGFLALYSGLIPSMLGSAPSSALYFGTYEYVRHRLSKRGNVDMKVSGLRLPINMVAAACGNVVSSFVFVPKEVIKQRLQNNYAKGVLGVVKKLIQERGLQGLYSGYLSTILRNVPSNALKFVLYEEVKSVFLLRRHRKDMKQQLSPVEHVVAGGIAGVLSSSITTPMDVLKTKFATGANGSSKSIRSLVAKILKEEGIGGFYVGYTSRIIWAALFSAIGFSSYEFFKKKLLGPQTNLRWTSNSQLGAKEAHVAKVALNRLGRAEERSRTARMPILR